MIYPFKYCMAGAGGGSPGDNTPPDTKPNDTGDTSKS